MELLTADQMRALEQAAIDSGAVTGLQLMERAGRGAVAAILAEWPALGQRPGRAVVFCGPGNNGGDGYVIARRLRDKGWRVEVFALGDPAKAPKDAAENRRLWAECGEIGGLDDPRIAEGQRPDLIIDALFGIGLNRPAPAAAIRAIAAARGRRPDPEDPTHASAVVAIDCPSGLDGDAGEILTPPRPPTDGLSAADAARLEADWRAEAAALRHHADLTITFHAPKIGALIGGGPGHCGALRIVDIGLPPGQAAPAFAALPAPGRLQLAENASPAAAAALRQWCAPPMTGAHKYQRGHVLVLAGGVGKGGAARLAARAALRAGAGLATLACPPAALIENAARLDAVMLKPLRGAAELTALLADPRFGAVCAGPGLGVGDRTRALVTAILAEADAPKRRVVLDADALTSFADAPETLFALLHENCLLTPHEGEFARLFPDLAAADRRRRRISKPDAAREAAARAGCTVLLKGPDTVIASPGGRATLHAAVYERAAPWLGTAGAGDVLAGIAAGLLARDPAPGAPHQQAVVAAWLHVEAARLFGPGLIAEDLPEMLPQVFRGIGL